MKMNHIAGEWVGSDEAIENRNPSDISDLIGMYAQATTDQLERALDSARGAQKLWQATGLEARQTALMKIGTALMARADDLGELLSREEGKPRAEGRGEIYRAGQFFTYYAAEVLRQIGDNADLSAPALKLMSGAIPSASSPLSARGIFPPPRRCGRSHRHLPSAMP